MLCISGFMDDIIIAHNSQEYRRREKRATQMTQQRAAGFDTATNTEKDRATLRLMVMLINNKNWSLSTVLTATDQKLQKSLKRLYYPLSHSLNVNMMLS